MKNRIFIYALSFGLSVGFLTHLYDFISFGFLPYSFAPLWINVYWTLLFFLDFIAIVFLFYRPNVGLYLTLLIMLSNVFINSYAYYSIKVVSSSFPLQFQSFFLGVVFGVFICKDTKKFS
ncbi:hypothetical protein NJR55_12345 [Idiomarina sp. M1R2S28]|uniref:Uncharacterized protein n=1 Tax=Idiomarina rhizosphaerae TaxID=2961572 RepID=A0A9X2JTX8_9GAMM|nr:hypothetical protein [Idiomarina rhizosphaerae]MCP1340380.1 hypothetical protein [Idiomarina rhizosphaerae]